MSIDNNCAAIRDLMLDYLSGNCLDEEKIAFELHIMDCPSCREEWNELSTVWEALPSDMEQIDPPRDLKEQVMLAVKRTSPTRGISRRKSWFAMTAALIVLLAGSIWNYRLYDARTASPPSLEQALSVPAANIRQLVALKPQGEKSANAYGVACIVDNGLSKQFVVYVFGANPTSGEQAYQVWLVRDNKRTSAGTFRVTDHGIGLLTMPITSATPDFDAIGITLEPDDHGDKPRGKKAFGSV